MEIKAWLRSLPYFWRPLKKALDTPSGMPYIGVTGNHSWCTVRLLGVSSLNSGRLRGPFFCAILCPVRSVADRLFYMQFVAGSIPAPGTNLKGNDMGQELTGFFREALDRDFVRDFSRDLLAMNNLFNQPIVGYIGFDCTADSLHVGNLASLMLLRLFRKHGHTPIIVLGTATSRIGDPSGKDEQRTMLSEEDIKKNMVGILPKIRRIVDPHWIIENGDLTHRINVIDFLAEVGQHVSVNRMLTQDSVKNRLDRGSPLSYLEFSYMVLQAYDFVQLYERHNCVLQMGGSDQWGNICMGIDLGRKMKGAELFGLTTPLITTAAGNKMGKTADGAVWLNAERLSPYEYWQFWRNTADADVISFLKMFTDLPLEMITKLKGLAGQDINRAKVILANEATAICHGTTASQEAQRAAESVFAEGGSDEGLPVTEIVLKPNEKIRLAEVFVKAGLVGSIGAAKRLAHDGGAYIRGDCRVEEDRMMEPAGFYDKSTLKISAGKKRHVLVSFLVR
jgi:tyrosyl-tRNA synthetase